MKFYESGDSSKPVIFLFPGTCCLYGSFDHILDRLHSYFYTVTVSYDGFDPNEKTEFYSMEDECEKIEQEIKKKYTYDTIRDYAEQGVDFISVGALTHSVKGLDMSFKACD